MDLKDRTTGNWLVLRWRRPLLTAHIPVSQPGRVDAALSGLGIAGWSSADPRSVYSAAAFVESMLIAPLVLAALATGVTLVALSPWTFRQGWVLVS